MFKTRTMVTAAACGVCLVGGGALGLAAVAFLAAEGPVDVQPVAFVQGPAAGAGPEAPGTDASLVKNMIDQPAKDAIKAGLAFLARSQHADGSFGTGTQSGGAAVTALAGLAFMAAGNQPGRGEYGKEVQRALDYVVKLADTRGFLQHQQAQLSGPMYGHGFGTLFLAEAHGMVQDPVLRDKVRKTLSQAVSLIVNTQNAEGGWRYFPVARDADLSVTICQIMALRAARNAGIYVAKDPTIDRCIKYVKDCQEPNGGFRYQKPQTSRSGFARSAAGVVALYSAGLYDGDEVKRGLEYLKQYQPSKNQGVGFQDTEARVHYFYGHYYAAQAMWIAGGNHWRSWFPAIRDDLVRGEFHMADGSWADRHFCPHYCTAMALIILQIPNNYLPILQR